MADLNQTKYPTNIRAVTPAIPATQTIYQDDVVLECNTAAGAITLDLLGIPFGSWSTQYKLYIIDSSSNAAVNNITINAGNGVDPNTGLPVAQTINGQASVTINTNKGAVLIRVIDNYKYIATYNNFGIGAGGYNLIQDEGAPLPQRTTIDFVGDGVTAIDFAGKTIVTIPGVSIIQLTNAALNVLITNNQIKAGQLYEVTDASYSRGVIVMGTATNNVTTYGAGLFYNADYQNVGNYSAVPGFTTNVGIWDDTYPGFVVGDVVIYNNLHYKSLTGATGTAPDTDLVNWQALAPSLTNGYIFESDYVIYDPSPGVNAVIHRADKRRNRVDFSTAGFGNTLLDFQWGRDACSGNIITGLSRFNATNCIATITDNILESGQFSSNTKHTLPGKFDKNVFRGGAIVAIVNNQGSFSDNIVSEESTLDITSIEPQGEIASNNINSKSIIAIDTVGNGGAFKSNQVNTGANITIANIGSGCNIDYNVFSASTININIILSSYFLYNTITNGSSFSSSGSLSRFQFLKNVLDSGATVTLTNASALIPDYSIIENCSITNHGSFLTPNFGNGFLGLAAIMQDCIIRNAGSIINYIGGFYKVINSRICEEGFSNWQENLDFTDPIIYVGTNVTIPNWMTAFVGEFTVTNLPLGGNITNISGAPSLHPFIFKPDSASTFTVTATAVGVAAAGDIIFNSGAASYTAVGRVNGCDEFTMKKYGNLIGLRDGAVWV